MARAARPITVTSRQRRILEKVSHRPTSTQQQAKRASMILLAADGHGNKAVAAKIGVHRETVSLWRERWAADWKKLCAIEAKQPKDKKFMDALLEFFSDAPRSGAPTTFSAEAVCQIIAVACEKPEESGHPVTHWTPGILQKEVIKRGIVDSISVRQIGRFLKGGRSKAASDSLLGNAAGE